MDELLLHYACVFMGVLTERVMEKIFSKLSDTVQFFWTVLHICTKHLKSSKLPLNLNLSLRVLNFEYEELQAM